MDVSIGEHLTLLCYSFFIGVFLGVLYDAVRLIRTFFGLGIDYNDSPLIRRLTPPIIGKRKKRAGRATGRAAAAAAVFVFDIIYMIAATAVTVVFVYHASSGTPRGFALFGEAIGFILYLKTVGRLTASVASYIFFAVDTVIRYFVYFTVTPIKIAAKYIRIFACRAFGATVWRAVRAVIVRYSLSREERYIDKRLEKMLAGIADAIGRGGMET